LSALFLPHICVTATVAGLSEFRPALTDYLLDAQQDDGSWAGYCWFEPAYATALAAKALRAGGESRAQKAVEQAVVWARSRIQALHEKKPTPFELARNSRCASHCAFPGIWTMVLVGVVSAPRMMD